ncbi:MAG: hypothetical protein FWE05_13450 [Defluviitaleaceae bacterium]|nr:hypothetical protein [Defluviitaleaceae bacterium]
MKFLVGIIGAVIFAVITWLVVGVLNIETGWLTHAIAGVVTFTGFSIAQAIYDKVKKSQA